ncbi:MAG: type II toxin-antitoxin system VapC family toxin [Dehalococcoidia bacterium]|nr:type II toxin-antitoxin system VapC family toxin [Dehalococcoidia bacterium]
MIRRRIGIDTSVLVRLATGDPPDIYARCVERLESLIADGQEILASNQVVGEAYLTLQHYYRISKPDARAALARVLSSGLVFPQNGGTIVDALESSGGPGLMDRLIADDYTRAGLETLTLDRRMASLPHASLV